MKKRILVALLLGAVAAFAVVASSVSATKKASASSITVWLQVDAQSGWPQVVAAANKAFEAQNPGVTVNVQYQQATGSACIAAKPQEVYAIWY